jgi:phospholipid-binding lipoprotein MlaA
MRYYLSLILLFITLSATAAPVLCVAAEPEQALTDAVSSQPALPAQTGDAPAKSPTQPTAASDEYDHEEEDFDYEDEPFAEERVTIADPIEPFNRAMNTFNDRMYFWLLKPAAQGYKAVAPEPARISVKNFFSNMGYPARFLSCLLQADFSGAATETGRFTINTLWGIGGLMDPAAGKELGLQKQDTDLGQTLGVYGIGHGFYIVWPFFGPSSPRDSVSIVGNQFLYPLSYFYPWYVSPGVLGFEVINATSLRIGEYESLIGAAIDPYVAMRNAYIQYRMKEVNARKAKSLLFKKPETSNPAADTSQTEK